MSSLENSDDLFLVIDHKSFHLSFHLSFQNPIFLSKSRDKFSFHPSKYLMTMASFSRQRHTGLFFDFSPPLHLVIPFSSLQNQPYITAHFRSSLHVLCIAV